MVVVAAAAVAGTVAVGAAAFGKSTAGETSMRFGAAARRIPWHRRIDNPPVAPVCLLSHIAVAAVVVVVAAMMPVPPPVLSRT